jgi:uncharacterized membrane protein affecting hemolysin expression
MSKRENLGACGALLLVKISGLASITYDVGFNPSTQRHYRRLVYYLYVAMYIIIIIIIIHVYLRANTTARKPITELARANKTYIYIKYI